MRGQEEKGKKGKGRGEKSLRTVKERWLWSFSRVTWLSLCWTCINGEFPIENRGSNLAGSNGNEKYTLFLTFTFTNNHELKAWFCFYFVTRFLFFLSLFIIRIVDVGKEKAVESCGKVVSEGSFVVGLL